MQRDLHQRGVAVLPEQAGHEAALEAPVSPSHSGRAAPVPACHAAAQPAGAPHCCCVTCWAACTWLVRMALCRVLAGAICAVFQHPGGSSQPLSAPCLQDTPRLTRKNLAPCRSHICALPCTCAAGQLVISFYCPAARCEKANCHNACRATWQVCKLGRACWPWSQIAKLSPRPAPHPLATWSQQPPLRCEAARSALYSWQLQHHLHEP